MDKKAERLRYPQYDESVHIFQLPIDKKLFINWWRIVLQNLEV